MMRHRKTGGNTVPQEERETLSIMEAARRLGIGRTAAYKAAAEERFPVPIIRVGGRLLVARAALDEVLGRRPRRKPRHAA
jgi:excisionase family DNA binding protein